MTSNKRMEMNNINLSPLERLDSSQSSKNHSYVNLHETETGKRVSSHPDVSADGDGVSIKGRNGNIPKQPIVQPLTISNVNRLAPTIGNPKSKDPKNWYSPPGSVQSNSRPTSVVGSKPHNQKVLPKLQTISEDAQILSIDRILSLCNSDKAEIQMNALAYLQHLIYNNNEKKMEVRNRSGIRTIIELTRSPKTLISNSALGVLKNLSYTNMEMIPSDIERLGGIQRMISIIKVSTDGFQKELAIDILWNLSVRDSLKSFIFTESVETLIKYVIIPESKLKKTVDGNYVPVTDDVNWSIILRNALGVIRNISYEGTDIRVKLRSEDGLIDSILHLIFMAKSNQETETNSEQMSLIDSKIIENCVCILRNLTYAIQEIVDPDYLQSRDNPTPKPKLAIKGKSPVKQRMPPPIQSEIPKGMELLWNAKYIVSALLPILKYGANAITLEAAAGIIQNLSAGDWKPSEEIQTQFRLQLALPTLVELIDIAPDEVIRSAATALRNLVREEFTCLLVGRNGLRILAEKIPMSSRSKKINIIALSAVLSTIYAIIKNQEEFMKDFIMAKGAERCIYVRDSDEFINMNDDDHPDKIRQFCKFILQILWKTPNARTMLKENNYKKSEIIDTRNLNPCNMCSPSNDSKSAKPYESNAYHPNPIDNDDASQGPPYFHDENRFGRDSYSTVVSNQALQERNSRAYTTNTIPGYGQVKVPVNNNYNRNQNRDNPPRRDHLSHGYDPRIEYDLQNEMNSYNHNDYSDPIRSGANYANAGNPIKFNQQPRSSGIELGYTNKSFVGPHDEDFNNPPPKKINYENVNNRMPPPPVANRMSEASNASDFSKHEYSRPMKAYNGPKVKDISENGDSWV